MTSRRHFGSVRKLPSGRYQAAYWHEGRRHTAPETFRAKADAQAWLSAIEVSIVRGDWLDPLAGRVTVGRYAAEWIAKRSDLRPTTRAKYTGLLRLHIEPSIGSVELSKLSPSAVRNWYHGLADSKPTTADDSYRFLRAVMNTAVTDAVIGRNPCQVRGAGQVRSAERPTASVAEVTTAVEAVPEQYRLAVLLPAWCQLRRGEVLGLQRRDVDLLHATIRVERAVVLPSGSGAVLGPPKTAAGTRTLNVPANIVPALQDHLDRFVGASPTAWLFEGEDGGPVSPRTVSRIWARARLAVGRPDLHLHDLRHSGLTWAAASGASVAELMRRGGHANPRAALRYQHATEDRDKAIADALAGLAQTAEIAHVPDSSAHVARTPHPGMRKAPSKKGA